ncbi:MAG: chemotaxis protein CheB, partial [Bacteroidota bacterium]
IKAINANHALKKLNHFVVGIGASAGGLEVLESFFNHASPSERFTFIVVSHLPKNHKSHLRDILARTTTIPVEEIKDGMTVEKGKIYVAPPHSQISVSEKRFSLHLRPDEEGIPYPIDYLFRALGEAYGPSTVGIILSGTGTDGKKGAKAIKAAGGLIMSQAPQSARYDGMPNAVIQAGLADFVLAPEHLPRKLQVFAMIKDGEIEVDEQEEQQDIIRQILQRILQELGLKLTHLKPEVVLRRVIHRQKINEKKSLLEYANYLFHSQDELYDLKRDLLQTNTYFYFEPEFWQTVREVVVPELTLAAQDQQIRIWVPACANGVEPYTIAMLFDQYLSENDMKIQIKIFASDIDKDVIDIARRGIFPSEMVEHLPAQLLQDYWVQRVEGFQVRKEIREMIVFTTHDLVTDPPLNRMDLISCRNLLSMLQTDSQRTMLYMLNFSMKKDGYLLLGQTDFPENISGLFSPLTANAKIYHKLVNRDLYRSNEFLRYTNQSSNFRSIVLRRNESKNRNELKLFESLNSTLLEEMGATCLLINEQFELLKYFGSANDYLNLPNEPQNWNLLRMIPLDTAASIRSGVRKSILEKKPVLLNRIRFQKRGLKPFYVDIGIRPKMANEHNAECIYLILRQATIAYQDWENISSSEGIDMHSQKVEQLENELTQTRESLQATIEELQTANEELMTSNEELQSANEELQSVNEELYSMNAEYQATIGKISDLNSDIENLLQNSHIGTLFLDQDLCIRRFNSSIFSIFSLSTLDIGRPIHHFSHNLEYPTFLEDIEQVFESHQSISREVCDQEGNWFLMHASPFIDERGTFAGLVLNLVDISLIKDSEHLKAVSLENQQNHKKVIQLSRELEETKIALDDKTLLYHSLWDENPDFLFKLNQQGQYKIIHSPVSPADTAELLVSIMDPVLEMVERCYETGEVQEEKLRIEEDHTYQRLKVRVTYLDETHTYVVLQDDSTLFFEERSHQKAVSERQQIVEHVSDTSIFLFDKEMHYFFAPDDIPTRESELLDFRVIFAPKQHSRVEKAQKNALRGKSTRLELTIEHEECEADFFPLTDEAGETYGGMLILEKVTDVNLVKRELESRLREMEQFTYAVSHDLKTPVRSITSFAQLLKRRYSDKLDQEGGEFIDFIVNNGQDMSELINGLLHFSLVGFEKEEARPVALNGLVDKVLQKLKVETSADNVKIEVDDLPVVMAHDVYMSQVFQNLIENALKFNESKIKHIDISAQKGANSWIVAVKDNGIGISETYIDQIFVIFKQLHTKDKFSGSGIGLALCKKITERLGGRIWVESVEGEGTTFFLAFPDQLVIA